MKWISHGQFIVKEKSSSEKWLSDSQDKVNHKSLLIVGHCCKLMGQAKKRLTIYGRQVMVYLRSNKGYLMLFANLHMCKTMQNIKSANRCGSINHPTASYPRTI